MSKISRNDIFIRDEKGPSWLQDFFADLANNKFAGTKDILDAIKNNTVEGVVKTYREQVGLDLLSAEETHESIKESSAALVSEEIKTAHCRPLSTRHASEKSIVDIINSDDKLKNEIENICSSSGGTKNTLTIINHIKEKLKDFVVKFSDSELIEYVDKIKAKYKQDAVDGEIFTRNDTSTEQYDDIVADYMTHGK